MTTTPPENPNADPNTPPSDEPTEGTGDESVLTPEDVRTQAPEPNKGSGQFAVWDHDLGQFVSGVSDKKTADAARKDLEGHNGAITDGHNLETREV